MQDFATIFTIIVSLIVTVSPFILFRVWKQKKVLTSRCKDYEERIKRLEAEKQSLQSEFDDYEDQIVELEAMTKGQNEAVENLSNQFVNDSLKFISFGVTANNYETSIKKAEKVFSVLRKFNIEFPEADEKQFYAKIKEVFEEEVKKDEARREQQLIKERIREEQRAEKERTEEINKLEKQTEAIASALEKAKRQFKNEHAEEITLLQKQLAEALANTERAKSQAQLTKAGFVYVISNIGAFGEQTFKVGMTRRLEPMDRVKELGDASVPFPFDVHLMVSCENAPELEVNLHRDLHKYRTNKVNMHKEFFNVELNVIHKLVEKHHGKVEYRATPEALEYNESRIISEKNSLPDYNPNLEVNEDERVA